jgi:hypothetical protein
MKLFLTEMYVLGRVLGTGGNTTHTAKKILSQ